MSSATISVCDMTEQEARQAITTITASFRTAESVWLDFRERRGWKAIGYATLTACVEKEFPWSPRTFFNICDRAEIRRAVGLPEGSPVAGKTLMLLKDIPPEEQRSIWEEAVRQSGREFPDHAILEQCVNRHLGGPAALPAPEAPASEPVAEAPAEIRESLGLRPSLVVRDGVLLILAPVAKEHRRAVWDEAVQRTGGNYDVPWATKLQDAVDAYLGVTVGPKSEPAPGAAVVEPAQGDEGEPYDPWGGGPSSALRDDLGVPSGMWAEKSALDRLSHMPQGQAQTVVARFLKTNAERMTDEALASFLASPRGLVAVADEDEAGELGTDGASLQTVNPSQAVKAVPINEGPPAVSKVVEVEHTVREAGDDPDDGYKPPRDEDWLLTLAVRSKLAPVLLPVFDDDAVFWRHAKNDVDLLRRQRSGELKTLRERHHGDLPPYAARLAYIPKWRGPLEWQACADCRGEETGLSSGVRILLGETQKCGTCKGRGYLIK